MKEIQTSTNQRLPFNLLGKVTYLKTECGKMRQSVELGGKVGLPSFINIFSFRKLLLDLFHLS